MSASPAPSRPAYLVVAFVTLWVLGMSSVHDGLVSVELVRDPLHSEIQAPPEIRDAQIAAVTENARIVLPLGIAEIMLGALLVIVAANALFGGRVTASFTLQVVAAHALLGIVAYGLEAPIRAVMIDTLVGSQEPLLAELRAEESADAIRNAAGLMFGAARALRLGVLAACAFAITRPRSRAWLELSPKTEER